MKRVAFVLMMVAILGCGARKSNNTEEDENEFNYETFSKHYATATLPYQLTDADLLKNKDTTRIAAAQFSPFVPDSIKKKLFGKTSGIRYIPIQKIENQKTESYFITKAVSGSKTAALLTVFDKDKKFGASFTFLAPDANTETTQASTIDKAYSISRNITRKGKNDVSVEGKDVYAFNAAINGFTLIMTDVLDEQAQELINPIDTFPRKHRFSGDYIKNKKSIVSIRDGRTPSELNMFVHFEDEEGCTGELKGTLFFTSTTTAVYRQGGDPCVLEARFSATSVTLREEEGCGSHRGLKCAFDGSFPKKDAVKQKNAKKKKPKK